MWTLNEINEFLKGNLKEDRYQHTLGVVEAAEKLAIINNVDVDKAKLAALVHDCAKHMPKNDMYDFLYERNIQLDKIEKSSPQILHGKIGAIIAREKMGIMDEEILSAVEYHTTGKENMTTLEKVIYIADYIEKNRTYEGVEQLREETFNNLDKGVIMGLSQTIKFVLDKNGLIHEKTIKARNYLIVEINEKG